MEGTMLLWETPEAPGRTSNRSSSWPNEQLLANADPGRRYRITEVVTFMARDLLGELGLREGDEVGCIENRRWSMQLERADGRRLSLQRDYAWFVEVEAVASPV
jgi:hypothetical protein